MTAAFPRIGPFNVVSPAVLSTPPDCELIEPLTTQSVRFTRPALRSGTDTLSVDPIMLIRPPEAFVDAPVKESEPSMMEMVPLLTLDAPVLNEPPMELIFA